MEIKELEARMYFLAGQLEEAKKFYKEALGEIERANRAEANKKQTDRKPETITSPSDSTVSFGEPTTV